ncbi:MAG TPA: glutaminyl-peptide cyclotransferase [Vicinamibacterales bacterium]|jgi:glutamine cyclotransferase
MAMVAAFYLATGGAPQTQPPVQVAVFGYQVVNVYPHDPMAFTQGLVFRDGFLYESTGLNGRSTLRKVRLETGEVIEQIMLGAQFFGEGLTDWHDQLLQLTWKSNIGFVYDMATLEAKRTFPIRGDGWGLTHDSTSLILSDGTAVLRFIDPVTFEEIGSYTVRDGGSPVANLNELEYIRGEIYANVWQTDRLVVIAPTTGQVTGWVDFKGLLADAEKPASADAVLNGIAYDAKGDRLFVTGKLWPKLFEVKLVRR